MDAKEIRDTYIGDQGHPYSYEYSALKLLREFVAQLAELNATLREEVRQDEIEEVTSTTPAQIKCPQCGRGFNSSVHFCDAKVNV